MAATSCKLRGTNVRTTLARFLSDQNYNPLLPVPSREIQVYSGTGYGDVIRSKGRDGATQVYLVSGEDISSYSQATMETQQRALPCHYCRQPFSWPAWGIPVARDQYRPNTYKVLYRTCRGECTLSLLRRKQDCVSSIRDGTYNNSEILLTEIWMKCYPGKVLEPADDPDLLDINGGPLTYAEYTKNRGRTISTSVVLEPAANLHRLFKATIPH